MRAFVQGAERRHARATPRPGCASSRAGRTRTWCRATGRSSPRRWSESQPGKWQALQTRDGWRAMRLDAITPPKPAVFESLRGVVLQDWTDATAAEQRTAAVRALAKKYKVEARGAALAGHAMNGSPRTVWLLAAAGRSPRRCCAAPARAHEMSMAEMEVRETAPGEFLWQWSAANDKRPMGDDLTPHWPEGCTAGPNVLHCGSAGLQGHADHRGRRQALLGRAGEGLLARRPDPRLHAHQRAAVGAALRLGRRPARHGRDRARLHRARRRAHPERHRSPAVRGRACCSWSASGAG